MDRLLPLRAVAELLSVRPSTILEWIEAGLFPAPVYLPSGRPRWSSQVVAGWLADPARHRVPATARAAVRIEDLSELEREIVQVLTEAEGQSLSGPEIARRISQDLDYRSGHWNRAMSRLKNLGVVISHGRNGGFSLAPDVAYMLPSDQGNMEGNTEAT